VVTQLPKPNQGFQWRRYVQLWECLLKARDGGEEGLVLAVQEFLWYDRFVDKERWGK